MKMHRTPWSLQAILEYELDAILDELAHSIPGHHTHEELRAGYVRKTRQTIESNTPNVVNVHTEIIGVRRQFDLQRYDRYALVPARCERPLRDI
jgi:hypothetical protein